MKILKKISILFLIFFTVILVYGITYASIFHLPKTGAYTILEKESSLSEFLLDETNYEQHILNATNTIEKSKKTDFISNSNVKLSYNMYLSSNPKASIIISHGYTECKEKYEEMIYYYLVNNYNVFIMDHRGHGQSTREVEDSSLVYIDSYDSYVEDLVYFIEQVVIPNSINLSLVLFGHSMGGGIATKLAQNYPDLIDLLILSAPMIRANFSLPEMIAYPVIKLANLFGMEKKYAISNGPYEENMEFNLEEYHTTSYARAYRCYQLRDLEHNKLWGASYGWLNSTIKAIHEIQDKKNIEKISVPVLLFQAQNDSLVFSDGHHQLASYIKDITYYHVENAKHEIWNESNEILSPYYNAIFSFIKENLKEE